MVPDLMEGGSNRGGFHRVDMVGPQCVLGVEVVFMGGKLFEMMSVTVVWLELSPVCAPGWGCRCDRLIA